MTTEDLIHSEFAKFGRGLHAILDALGNQTEMLTAIHEAMTKEPPPSKIPEALAKLEAEVRALRLAFEGRVVSDRTNHD